jgi:hypothetical protein
MKSHHYCCEILRFFTSFHVSGKYYKFSDDPYWPIPVTERSKPAAIAGSNTDGGVDDFIV